MRKTEIKREGVVKLSLDKAIKYGKEKRKQYRGSKAIDSTCRNHGGCPYCEQNRRHKFRDRHPYLKTDGRDCPSFSYGKIHGVHNTMSCQL